MFLPPFSAPTQLPLPPIKKKRERGNTTSDCSWCSGRSFQSPCGHSVGRMQRQVDVCEWEFQCFLHYMCRIRLDKGGEESYRKQKDRKKLFSSHPHF